MLISFSNGHPQKYSYYTLPQKFIQVKQATGQNAWMNEEKKKKTDAGINSYSFSKGAQQSKSCINPL